MESKIQISHSISLLYHFFAHHAKGVVAANARPNAAQCRLDRAVGACSIVVAVAAHYIPLHYAQPFV